MTVWINLHDLAAAWVKNRCDAALSAKFEAQYESRRRTSAYESACWGALEACKMLEEARHMKDLVRGLMVRQVGDEIEVNLGRQPIAAKPEEQPKKPAMSLLERARAQARKSLAR